MSESGHPLDTRDAGSFATTQWSLVLAAAQAPTSQSRAALAALCEVYWYPLYAFARRRGLSTPDAADLTQGFFARLLEKNDLAAADRQRGRFRSWLLGAMKHYMCDQWDKQRALKRGGGKVFSFDAEEAEGRFRSEPAHEITPERDFDRQWALTLLAHVLDALEREIRDEGKGELFDKLQPFLVPSNELESYGQVGAALGISEGAAKVAVHRLRRRYRDLLRQQVARTMQAEDDVDQEIRELFDALG